MYRKIGIMAVIALVIIAFVLPAASQQTPDALSVYDLTGADAKAVAKEAFKVAGSEKTEGSGEDASEVTVEGGKKVSVDKLTKKVHYDSGKAMQDPTSEEAKKQAKNLPDKAQAKGKTDELLGVLGPSTGGVLNLEPTVVTGSGAVVMDVAKGTEEVVPLDVVTTTGLRLIDEGLNTPVIGAEYRVELDANAEVTKYDGPQPGLKATKGKEFKSVSKETAESKFKVDNKNAKNVNSKLAYFATGQQLIPVYAIDAEIDVDGNRVAMRTTLVPAIEGADLFPGKSQKEAEKGKREAQPKEAQTSDDKGTGNKLLVMSGIPGEAGTEYIGVSGGLPASKANALGFTDSLKAAGWKILFTWGDSLTWETDWIANDDLYVDTADIVFYSGHANSDGWVVSPPNDNFVHYSEVGARCATPDIWGANDLEWLTIAACGPLQDSHIPGASGNAFSRWMGAFDGLHTLMGYAQVTYDQPYEGDRFAGNMKAGMPIIDAWFKAARDSQPGGIYAVALYGVKGTENPRNDHLWGYGSVCADPYPCPDYFVLTWSPC